MARVMASVVRKWSRARGGMSYLFMAVLGGGCSGGEDAPPPGLYDAWRRLEVQVEVDERDWEALRHEGYSLFDHLRDGAREFDYSYFEATVTIDGKRLERVALRKKGSVGSSSRLRPSLVLDLNRNIDDQELYGATRLTLNNDQADAAHARQCLAYELFVRAGLPAPRCGLAHVTVNGQDLGTFTNVEPIRKPFLAREFGDDSGNLYEGRGNADFTLEDYEGFEIKTNEGETDRSDLRAVALALQADDAHVVAELGEVLDLDQFRRFWAVETLTANWDGYGGNRNNYFVYHDPVTGKFQFLPWGTDAAFSGDASGSQAVRIYTRAALARRLYGIPEERARFHALLAELVATVYDTDRLSSRASELQDISTDAWPGDTARLRQYIRDYPSRLSQLIGMPEPDQSLGELTRDECDGLIQPMAGSFDTALVLRNGLFGEALNGMGLSNGFQAQASVDGGPIEAVWSGVLGREPGGRSRNYEIDYVGHLPDGRQLGVIMQVPPLGMRAGSLPFYNYETFGMVFVRSEEVPFDLVGWLSEGAIHFDTVGTRSGEPVAGTFQGQIYQLKCLNP